MRMWPSLGPDDWVLETRVQHRIRGEERRRTVSTSFEQGSNKRDDLITRRTQSYAYNMVDMVESKTWEKQIIDSTTEGEMIDKENKVKKVHFLGIILVMIGIIVFQGGSVVAKKLQINPFLMVLIRDILQGSINTPFVIQANENPFPKGRKLLILIRGLAGGVQMMGHFYAVRYLPMADVMMISSVKPVFATLLSWIFLKEQCGLIEMINLLLVISGIFLVVQPSLIFGSTDQEYTTHMLVTALGLLGAKAVGASVGVIIRYLRDMHWAALAISTRIIGVVEMFLVCSIMGLFCIPECGFERWGSLLVAVVGCITQVCFIFALKNEQAHIIGLVDNAGSVAISFFFQVLFFNDFPNTLKIIGACLVLSSILLIGGQKIWVKKRK